jgi:hypothetical protein
VAISNPGHRRTQDNTANAGHNRREALKRLAIGAVGAATSSVWVESLSALARDRAHEYAVQTATAGKDWAPKVLSAGQNETVIALTELIIPQTDTPGAKATNVNRFVDWVLSDAPSDEREKFLNGLKWLDDRSMSRYKKDFASLSAEQQTAVLTPLTEEGNLAAEDAPGVAFFQAIKSMTISGYYSTEIGLRQELGDDGQMFLPAFKGCDHPEHMG